MPLSSMSNGESDCFWDAVRFSVSKETSLKAQIKSQELYSSPQEPLCNKLLRFCCRMYAFDVHCNSYFPLFLLLYGELLHWRHSNLEALHSRHVNLIAHFRNPVNDLL